MDLCINSGSRDASRDVRVFVRLTITIHAIFAIYSLIDLASNSLQERMDIWQQEEEGKETTVHIFINKFNQWINSNSTFNEKLLCRAL